MTLHPIPLLLAVPLLALQGCFIYVDDTDPDPVPVIYNEAPFVVDSADTWWDCGYSAPAGDYIWEFQAVVGDPDGLGDVDSVAVDVYLAGSDLILHGAWLDDEGGGVFGGLVYEYDADLRCGIDEVDVLFSVWDVHGASDSLWL